MVVWDKITAWAGSTHIPEQIKAVDAAGLFTNPWFMVPFVIFIGWTIYKLQWKDLIITGVIIGVWWVSGTPYMSTLVVGDKVQIDKILPIVFGAAAVVGLLIYMFFGRSD